jgi:2-C-methyl-D-erythritol 4-phosphate cytidylyltransferase / 2-C-methyl-D-erythritol 2,4-cyclodiphosphate synthase
VTTTGQATVTALLAAAGLGTRFSQGQDGMPKQFLKLHGRPMYTWSLEVLLDHPGIAQIIVLVPTDLVSKVEAACARLARRHPDKAVLVRSGGATRQGTVYQTLEFLAGQPQPPEYVLIHDAARPFLTSALVDAAIEEVQLSGACTAGIAPCDTVKRIASGVIVETLDRPSLLLVQTPQAARFAWLLAAHRLAIQKGLATTDDAALLEAAGHTVTVTPGSPYNLKVTTPEDLNLCQAIFSIVFRSPL